MALANGADVRIEGKDFMLATDIENSYVHQYENLYPTTAEVAGTDKKTSNQNILLWGYDNFVGGDGLKYYDADQPDRWNVGQANPRGFPGSITSPPTRSEDNLTTSVTPTGGGDFVVAGGQLLYFTGEQGWETSTGTSWDENTDVAVELPASYQITGATSDGEYAYIAASDGSNRGIWRVTPSSDTVDDFVSAHASTAEYKALATRDGFLYGWTGGALLRYELDDSLPITHSTNTHRKFLIRDEGIAVGSMSADMVEGNSSVMFMRAWSGHTTFFEYKIDPQTNKLGPRTFWKLPMGFTGRKICLNTGVLYCVGEYSGKAALFGYSLASRQPFFLGYVGETLSITNVRFLTASFGAQVMMGVDDGTTSYIYIYDAEKDAFSVLDDRPIANDGTLLAGATYKSLRFAASFATTTTDINRWQTDTDTPAGPWDWDSAAHDFDYPQDEKVLLGFHVIQDPTIAAGTVNVDYQIDEDGNWLDAGTTSAGAKHTYIQVSTGAATKKFRTLRMRMTGASGCRVFSIMARAYVNSKQETWRLVLDLNNEPGTTRRTTNRTVRAARLRDYILNLVEAGNVITFKDGRRYPNKNDTADTGFTQHECLIEFPKDSIDSATEGRCEIILRSVSPSVS